MHATRQLSITASITILLVTSLAACGNDAGTGHSTGDSGASQVVGNPATEAGSESGEPTDPQHTTPAALPTEHYVLLCSSDDRSGGIGELVWLDPNTLDVIFRQTIMLPEVSDNGHLGTIFGFVATPSPVTISHVSRAGSIPGCGSWQLSADKTLIAGTLKAQINGQISVVPASHDLVNGIATELVKQPDTGGFTAPDPLTYVASYYAPDGRTVWSLSCGERVEGDTTMSVHSPDGAIASDIRFVVDFSQNYAWNYLCGWDQFSAEDAFLLWPDSGSTPVFAYGSGSCDTGVRTLPIEPSITVPNLDAGTCLTHEQAQKIGPFNYRDLPASNWIVGVVHRSPDGSKGAFVGQNKDSRDWGMFTVDGAGTTTPIQVRGDLSAVCSSQCDVVEYRP